MNRPGRLGLHLVDTTMEVVEFRRSMVRQHKGKERHRGNDHREDPTPPKRSVSPAVVPRQENRGADRERHQRKYEPRHSGQPEHEEGDAEPCCAPPGSLAGKEDECLEDERNPHREQVGKVRHQPEPERHERERNSGNPGRTRRARQRPSQSKSSVAARGEGEEHRHRVDRQRPDTEREQREKWQRNSVAMLAEGERKSHGIEQVRVKEIERIGKGLVVVPPQNPGDEIRIASVHDRIPQMQSVGPGQQRGEGAKGEEDQRLADDAIALEPG